MNIWFSSVWWFAFLASILRKKQVNSKNGGEFLIGQRVLGFLEV